MLSMVFAPVIDTSMPDTLLIDDVDVWKLADDIAECYGLDGALVRAVMKIESNGDIYARHKLSGCLGLMQIFPKWHGNQPDSIYFQPETNLDLGCGYLVWLFEMFPEDTMRVLTAYNYGQNHKQTRVIGTSDYAKKVMKVYKLYGQNSSIDRCSE